MTPEAFTTALTRIAALEETAMALAARHDDNARKISANSSDMELLQADMATIAGSIGAITAGNYSGAGMQIVSGWAGLVETGHRLEAVIQRFWPKLFLPRVNELPPPPTQQQNTDPAIGG